MFALRLRRARSGPALPHHSARGTLGAILSTAVLAIGVMAAAVPAEGAAPADQRVDAIAAHIDEAALRFGIPASWIRAVMRAESGGDVTAVSPKGAMGLLQIMPKTWETLRARYGLGDDPYDPRDNILAGTAYLREMFDRFGSPGFLAAYNAGPGRYEGHLATGRRLPAETRAYLAKLTPAVGATLPTDAEGARPDAPEWTSAPLFVALKTRAPTDTGATDLTQSDRTTSRTIVAALSPAESSDELFVRRSPEILPRP